MLGCAPENLALSAGARGQAGEIGFDPEGGGRVRVDPGTARAADATLFDAIPLRRSTRSDNGGSAVSAADLSQIDQLRDPMITGDTTRMVPFFCEVTWITPQAERRYFRGTVARGAYRFAQ